MQNTAQNQVFSKKPLKGCTFVFHLLNVRFMWNNLAEWILKNRFGLLIALLLGTIYMGYRASELTMSYNQGALVPVTDTDYVAYQQFRQQFGVDGTVLVAGFRSKDLFTLEVFNDWRSLGIELGKDKAVKQVLSVANMPFLYKDTARQQFVIQPIISKPFLQNQAELDSARERIVTNKFFEGLMLNTQTNATLMGIAIHPDTLNSKNRINTVNRIIKKVNQFAAQHDVEMHYSGLPQIRTAYNTSVKSELKLFSGLSVLVCATMLWFLFRSVYMVFFPVLGVLIGAVWSMGFIACLGYQITILSGLIPALMVVIGISCCVYLLNRYHIEYQLVPNKNQALKNMVKRIGVAALVTNATTAIGFFVFYFTDTKLLVEFGLVCSLGVVFVFSLALIYIPVVFSYLPAPNAKQTKHLNNKLLTSVLHKFNDWAVVHPKYIFMTFGGIVLFSAYGVSKINAVGYIVDDIPKTSKLFTDLQFFQTNFRGVMPLDVVIDTGKKGGAQKPSNIEKIQEIQQIFALHPEFSKPISLVEMFKMANQAYYNGSVENYRLPTAEERTFVIPYAIRALKGSKSAMTTALTDSTRRTARISYSMSDVGTKEIRRIMQEITPKIDSITQNTDLKVRYTGTTLLFLKGNQYLIDSLIESLLLGYLFVILAMLPLFRSIKLLALSFLANLVPQLFTAGIMGYFDIHVKPSTVLIFSIAFCISIDASIHLLNRYAQVIKNGGDVRQAASTTILETGSSIIYAALILSFGFAIFAASEFQGTVALGVLIAITLLMGLFSTLLLLPALLVRFGGNKKQ